jgi:hypothetical protein
MQDTKPVMVIDDACPPFEVDRFTRIADSYEIEYFTIAQYIQARTVRPERQKTDRVCLITPSAESTSTQKLAPQVIFELGAPDSLGRMMSVVHGDFVFQTIIAHSINTQSVTPITLTPHDIFPAIEQIAQTTKDILSKLVQELKDAAQDRVFKVAA